MATELGEMPPSKYVGIPLNAIGPSSRKKLSLYLNLEGTLNDDIQCENNYRGLAELAGFSYLEIKNFEIQKSPTEEMLHEWTVRQELSPTVDRLWKFLHMLERFDVLTDCQAYISKDCEAYLEKKAKFVAPIQEQEVTQSTDPVSPCFITVSDVQKGTATLYDAFVCYSPEGPDHEFIMEMIQKLEGEYKMKLFIPERDGLAGLPNNTTVAQLIQHRCKRMLIILSPRFLKSPSCDFQTKFAQSLSPGAREKKLVPILIERCVIPEIIRFITLVDYTKKDLLQWFWYRLASSLKAPLDPMPTSQESGSWNSCSRTDSSSSSILYSRTSGSSYASSSSDKSSFHESLPSSSSSSSYSPSLVKRNNRSGSPRLSSREEDDFIMVEKAGNQQSGSPAGSTPPKLPSTANRAPLPKQGSSTQPLNRGSNTSPQQKKKNKLLPNFLSKSKGSVTAPVNRPLPAPPTETKDKKDQEVFC